MRALGNLPAVPVPLTRVTPVAGDGFEEFVGRAWPGLVRIAAAVCLDRQGAEDAVQETLARVWVRWPSISPTARLTYTRRAVVRAALPSRRGRRGSEMLTTALPEHADAHPDIAGDLMQAVVVQAALRRLPPRARAVLGPALPAGTARSPRPPRPWASARVR